MDGSAAPKVVEGRMEYASGHLRSSQVISGAQLSLDDPVLHCLGSEPEDPTGTPASRPMHVLFQMCLDRSHFKTFKDPNVFYT